MNAGRLPRVLSLFDVSVLSSASMGPAYSLASTMGPMVAAAGTFAPLSLLVLAGIMACIAVGFGRLSAKAPNAGSSFAWIGMAFGPRAGAYGAWLLILSNFFATMATALPAGTYTLDLLAPGLASSPVAIALVGVVWIAASGALLFAGLRPTAAMTAIFLLAELAVLGLSALAASFFPHAAPPPAGRPPAFAFGGIVAAMVLGVWMTDGWEVSASASEEAKGDRRTPGSGGLLGLALTSLVLLACMSAYLRLAAPAGFEQHQTDSMAFVADRLGGGVWRFAIVATVLLSTSAALWTTMLYLSRSTYAMGRDGMLPEFLGALDHRSLPSAALLTVSLLLCGSTLLTGVWPTAAAALTFVLNGSSIFLGALFCLTGAACVALFRDDAGKGRISGALVPGAGSLLLGAVIAVGIAQGDGPTRLFALAGFLAGVPLALWRGPKVRALGEQPTQV